jgi:hypothetical protein
MRLLAGTDDGLFALESGGPARLRAGKFASLVVKPDITWSIVDEGRIERLQDGHWHELAAPAGVQARSLLPIGGSLLIGTSEAHLYRAAGESGPELVSGFERAPGRDSWHTPWGGPPDTRSLAQDADGTIYANVHVGGVLRSRDGEDWQPTLDIAADVHQVSAHPALPGCVLVASARGLGLSFDAAASWTFSASGLHNSYARALAVADDVLLLSASDGPRGGRAALYRRGLRSSEPFERCCSGLPEWIEGNIDSGCVVADGTDIAFGTAAGDVFRSADGGSTWQAAASGLPPIRSLGSTAASR